MGAGAITIPTGSKSVFISIEKPDITITDVNFSPPIGQVCSTGRVVSAWACVQTASDKTKAESLIFIGISLIFAYLKRHKSCFACPKFEFIIKTGNSNHKEPISANNKGLHQTLSLVASLLLSHSVIDSRFRRFAGHFFKCLDQPSNHGIFAKLVQTIRTQFFRRKFLAFFIHPN